MKKTKTSWKDGVDLIYMATVGPGSLVMHVIIIRRCFRGLKSDDGTVGMDPPLEEGDREVGIACLHQPGDS